VKLGLILLFQQALKKNKVGLQKREKFVPGVNIPKNSFKWEAKSKT
jgi:hypothetical protein